MSAASIPHLPIWIRPGLTMNTFLGNTSDELDTALFDVDGVLLDTRRSYRLSVIAATEYLVREMNGLRNVAPSMLMTPEDVALFKSAGGFNNDWDATQLFASLWTARLREWHGQPEARVSMKEWADRASIAAKAGHGGAEWVRMTFPASAIPNGEIARWVHDEYYWGAALVKELYGRTPQYAPDVPGFVHNEEALITHELLPALTRHGITRFGLITGRQGLEVGVAVQHIAREIAEGVSEWHEGEHGRSPFACVVSSNLYTKPDPRALTYALRELETRAALYVGDTADDLELVLRYRLEAQRDDVLAPPTLSVMIAEGDEAELYQHRGADIVIERIGQLPKALAMIPQTMS